MITNSIIALVLLAESGAITPIVPNTTITPGAVDPAATVEKVCTPGYSQTVRNVSHNKKLVVYGSYGIPPHTGKYEVDHLISLELGGSNDIKNLWPQSYETQPWNAHVKDKLENKLHEMICSGQMPMKDAQDAIAKDWISAYCKYVSSVNCKGLSE